MSEQDKSYSQMRKEFYYKYEHKILPLIKTFEDKRKSKLLSAVISSSIFCILGAFCLYIGFLKFDERETAKDLMQIAVSLFGIAYIIWFKIKKNFEISIKKKIMSAVCNCYGKMHWTDGYHQGYSEENLFKESRVISDFTLGRYDDIFKGIYKDTAFEIIESQFIKYSGKKIFKRAGNKQTTVFKGVIVKFAMNKNFVSHTVIKPNSLYHNSPSKDLRHTELEDVIFEKKYDVFTNDEVEARYLITPSFMERLNKMKTAFKSDKVSCAFYKDILYVALETSKDLFSLCSLVKPIDNREQYIQMYEEIVSILKLIDHFKLYQKIGL